jgi:hypothetical protein
MGMNLMVVVGLSIAPVSQAQTFNLSLWLSQAPELATSESLDNPDRFLSARP